jgi:hypothetical protein
MTAVVAVGSTAATLTSSCQQVTTDTSISETVTFGSIEMTATAVGALTNG